jgi:dTDP-4-amino-4,6-dideoxygalactose transaminase
MKNNPYKIVQMFEDEIASYCGSKYAVSVDSCTNAIFLCIKYYAHKKYSDTSLFDEKIIIPKKTYLSVPMSIIHAGGSPVFQDIEWSGIYPILGEKNVICYDAAKRFTSEMYIEDSFMCLSFHIKKHLKIGKGGMILCNDEDAVKWFKKARYEGRSEKMYHEDNIDMLGWNMYMTPQQASHGLALMQNMPRKNDDLIENDGYRDLTEFKIFKQYL